MVELSSSAKKVDILAKILELDTAATVFPLAFSDDYRGLVRLILTMNKEINKDNMQLALNNMMKRFPTFFVKLNNNRFKYYFERLNSAPIIIEKDETDKPLFMTLDDLKSCAFRIIVNKKCLYFEYFHAITDGYGASVFFKSLIKEYLYIEEGVTAPAHPSILDLKESPKYDEIKNAYPEIVRVSNRKINKSRYDSGTYLLKGDRDDKIHITEFSFNTDELLSLASEHEVTLTIFLSCLLTKALFDLRTDEGREEEEIRLSIPVDLRKFFHSETLRNFAANITISAGKLADEMDFSKLCKSYEKELQMNLSKAKLSALANSYVRKANNKILTSLPLNLKRWIVRRFYSVHDVENSMTFSNLGVFSFPDNLKKYMEKCSLAFSPKPLSPYSCGVVSLGNSLTLTLTRSIKEPILEPRLLKIFKENLSVKNIDIIKLN